MYGFLFCRKSRGRRWDQIPTRPHHHLICTQRKESGLFKEQVTGTKGLPNSSRDQASSPPFPSPCLSPLYPLPSSPSLPFFSPLSLTHTNHFIPNPSDSHTHYLRSAGTVVQFLPVGSRSALGVVPESWSAQWQLHWGDTARCCRGSVAEARLLRAPAVCNASTVVGGTRLARLTDLTTEPRLSLPPPPLLPSARGKTRRKRWW